jgi:hypothetical protein
LKPRQVAVYVRKDDKPGEVQTFWHSEQ